MPQIEKSKSPKTQWHRILARLQKDGSLTASQAGARVGGIRDSARKALSKLAKMGYVKAVVTPTVFVATQKLKNVKDVTKIHRS